MTTQKQRLSLLVIALSFLFACTEDYFEFDKIITDEWSPEFAVPLINSSLNLENILANEDTAGLVSADPNTGVLQVVYEGNVISKVGGDNISLEDQDDQSSFSGIVVPPGPPLTIPYNTSINYSPSGGVEVDSVLLKGGNFVMTLESEFRHPIQVVITYPGFKDASGQTLQMTFNLPPSNGSSPAVRSLITDLSGFKIDMTNNGTGVNSIPINTSITITPIPDNPSSTNDELRFVSNIRNIDFKDFYGYIGQAPLDLSEDTILIALFKNFDQGRFFLSDPTLGIRVSNSYGMPLTLTFDYLNAATPDFSPTVQAINLGNNNPKDLNAPSGRGTAFTTIDLTKDNSNIAQIISSLLKSIAYDANAVPNAGGNTGRRNYISDTSSIGLDVSLKLPFTGFASGLVMEDTIDFEFESAENLKSGIIRTRMENGFPIQGALQLIFTDKNYLPLDSLYASGQEVLIPAAPVDANGFSSRIASALKDTEIKGDRLNKLKNSKFAILRAELETTNGALAVPDTVTFLAGYKLDVAVGIKAKVSID